MKDYREVYKLWCTDNSFDAETQAELLNLATDENEIEDRFYRDLEFGTGGLRGVIGAGTNRMNIYTVRKATQGLANYIIKQGGQKDGVAIAYDSRRMSVEFALETALCFAANGVKAYLFDDLRPTPELSFAVRELGCIAGVVITASHNPPEYNGYKVYWQDGGQITFPRDKEIIAEVNAIEGYDKLKTISREAAISAELLIEIGKEIDDAYIRALKEIVLNPEVIQDMSKDLKIVYTPIHGTGNIPVRRVLKELGFEHTYVVKEQELPDGEFPTVAYPNPEDPAVFAMALDLAKEVDADIILATDPDADRLGVYAKNPETGGYEAFNGNMSGILICEYELEQKKSQGLLTENSAVIKTIVTTNMTEALAKEYDVHCLETLTGFKYIGEQIKLFEENKSYTYEFGFEESYGCLVGTHARDKDAVVAVMALCEAAAYYKSQGLTLWQQMLKLYGKYGYYMEDLATQTLKGKDGLAQIKAIMERYRTSPLTEIGGFQVLEMRDYLQEQMSQGKPLPKSNVLYFELSNDAWVCVRPSGTEPKIKYYFGVKGSSMEDAQKKLEEVKKNMS